MAMHLFLEYGISDNKQSILQNHNIHEVQMKIQGFRLWVYDTASTGINYKSISVHKIYQNL